MYSETKYYTFANPPDLFQLESGRQLSSVTLAYETYGILNRAGDNAILILHGFTADAHAAGVHRETGRVGWWDDMIGPGKAFDTDKYFVVCSNVLGGCSGSTGPSSMNPETGSPYGSTFPVVSICDMVNGQYLFAGIGQWSVNGRSAGTAVDGCLSRLCPQRGANRLLRQAFSTRTRAHGGESSSHPQRPGLA